MTCPVQACPIDNFFEYVPASPLPCFCASPLKVGYRLKSPSFSYFDPYVLPFELYVTSSLNLNPYQLAIDSYFWEEGPRLRMHLNLFPPANNMHSNTFNVSEVRRIRGIFTSWQFPGDGFFGPYELLNFTLVGPYAGSMYSKFLLLFRLCYLFFLLLQMMLNWIMCSDCLPNLGISIVCAPRISTYLRNKWGILIYFFPQIQVLEIIGFFS
jgi:hypothetical protein